MPPCDIKFMISLLVKYFHHLQVFFLWGKQNYFVEIIGIMVRVLTNGLGKLGFNPRSSHTKQKPKMVLDAVLL